MNKMRPLIILVAILISAPSAFAAPKTETCRVERLESALAACLELTFAQRVVAMSQQINDTLVHLQAATSGEMRDLQRQYNDAQNVWLNKLAETCEQIEGDDPVAFQSCRLAALERREERLALSLKRAADDFGAPLTYSVPTPKNVEIRIPLATPLPFGGVAELPLLLPISPD